MSNDHWFDAWNKVLIRATPRRVLLGATAALVASLALGAPVTQAAKNRKGQGKGKGKGQGKGKGKGKPNPNPPPPCSGGACAAEWPSDSQYDTDNRNHCESVCRACPNDAFHDFCIQELRGPNGDLLGKVAACCADGLTCCAGQCVDTFSHDNHCSRCDNPCSPGKVCFGGECVCQEGLTLCGEICRDTKRDENHCGGCDQPCPTGASCVDRQCRCPAGRIVCGDSCIDTSTAQFHCGGCDQPCTTPARCCDGQCCGGVDLPDALFRCCAGHCVNWATDENNCHPDVCGLKCPRAPFPERTLCCAGNCLDPSRWTCCPNGLTACPTDLPYPYGCRPTDSGNGWECGPL